MLRMANPRLVFLSLLVLLLGMSRSNESALVETVAAQELPIPDRPVDKLSLGHPFWRRGTGLVYGAMALNNQNSYSVNDVIISCDFFDERGESDRSASHRDSSNLQFGHNVDQRDLPHFAVSQCPTRCVPHHFGETRACGSRILDADIGVGASTVLDAVPNAKVHRD
jgi:hypothetical protein